MVTGGNVAQGVLPHAVDDLQVPSKFLPQPQRVVFDDVLGRIRCRSADGDRELASLHKRSRVFAGRFDPALAARHPNLMGTCREGAGLQLVGVALWQGVVSLWQV